MSASRARPAQWICALHCALAQLMANGAHEIVSRLPSVPQKVRSAVCQVCDTRVRDAWCVADGCGGWIELRHWRAGSGGQNLSSLSEPEYGELLEWLERERVAK